MKAKKSKWDCWARVSWYGQLIEIWPSIEMVPAVYKHNVFKCELIPKPTGRKKK